MKTKEILERNELIAEFMGAKTDERTCWPYRVNGNSWKLEGLKYHTSWDWLMPVYLKITKLIDEINTEEAVIIFNILYEKLADGNGIEEVYKYIIKFIKLYNTQKQ